MHASTGTGGYCDCGDEEAWSSGPACNKHKDGMDVDNSIVSPVHYYCIHSSPVVLHFVF